MRRYLMILTVAVLSLGTAQAQRYLPGQKGIEITGGFVDGFKLKKQDGQAFYGNLSISTYNKKANRWVFGAEYLQKRYDYRGEFLPSVQITAEGGHYMKFLSDPSKTVFLSVGGSALLGYETVNWGKQSLHDGARIADGDSFIYGAAVNFEVETYLSDRIVFLIRARERVVFGSPTGNFHFQLGAGIKIMIR